MCGGATIWREYVLDLIDERGLVGCPFGLISGSALRDGGHRRWPK